VLRDLDWRVEGVVMLCMLQIVLVATNIMNQREPTILSRRVVASVSSLIARAIESFPCPWPPWSDGEKTSERRFTSKANAIFSYRELRSH
jgi:hypothetical protein